MKHLFKEHKISLHGYMLVKIATMAYVVGRNYVLIFVSLSRINNLENGLLLHMISI